MLDQLIAWLSPDAALRRARARAALSALGARAYEGASRADRMSDWRTTSNSAAAEVAPALELLRARARDLRRNNPWAARGVALIASNLVVYGIAASIEANGKGAQKRAERLMPALKAWAESTACDADGMSNLAGLQSLVAASVAGDGEILIRRRMRRLSDGLPVPMQLQLLEGDYLQNTTQTLASGRIVQGVEFRDANGSAILVEELSDGYRSLLSMTFELLRQLVACYGQAGVFRPRDATRVAAPGVVLIDEVDAHLHPSWQRELGLWMRKHFPRIQFIVTTHSPLICQAADVGSVWCLPRPGTDEEGRMLTGGQLERVLYGDPVEAYESTAFNLQTLRSDHANRLLSELTSLNQRALTRKLSATQRKRQNALRALFPSAAAGFP